MDLKALKLRRCRIGRQFFLLSSASIIVFVLILEYHDHKILKKPSRYLEYFNMTIGQRIPEYPSALNEFGRHDLTDDRLQRSRIDIARDTQKTLPHLPILVWEEHEYRNWYYKNSSCARFPEVYDLQMYDRYWQVLRAKNREFHLFRAYYDVRERCANCPAVRILGMINITTPPPDNLYCQVWFANNTQPAIVRTAEYFNVLRCWWGSCDGFLYTYLITCPLPREFDDQQPTFVSLVESKCDTATNILTVNYDKPLLGDKKDHFAVCVKMLDFFYEDQSVRLIEWIELLRLLGAAKIFFYTLNVHENMTKVFEYYEQQGLVEVVPITLGGYQPNTPGFQHLYLYSDERNWYQRIMHELISLNDCFYKNLYRYHYVTLLDIDEVIVPVKETTWLDLMTALENATTAAAYRAPHTFFTSICDDPAKRQEDVPSYMYMLQHVLRHNVNVNPINTKTFYSTELVEAVHNHWPAKCLNKGGCAVHYISPEDAQLHHYREEDSNAYRHATCEELRPNITTDTTLWKYKEPLVARTLAVLYKLGFFS